MKTLHPFLAVMLLAVPAPGEEPRLYNPYDRPKNGPPLTNVFHKAQPLWLWDKLKQPKHHPSARMPDFKFSDEEAMDALAYLKSIADPSFPKQEWPPWTAKTEDTMNDEELTEMMNLTDMGKAVWGNARCTVCHKANGPGGTIIGGFVDLRVGGIDLQIAQAKLERDWLYSWVKEPKSYFLDTLMPRYRLSDSEARALVEFLLRDEAFRPTTEPKPEAPGRWKALDDPSRISRGKRLIELSRCVVCHDIKGILELLSFPPRPAPPSENTVSWLFYDVRCLSCHSIEGRGGTYAPDLTSEGSRLKASWIHDFLIQPDLIRPLSQQMPKFNLSPEEAKTVADYVQQFRRDPRVPTSVPPGEAEKGRALFQSKGCVACHTTGEGPGGGVGPTLDFVADRLEPGYLFHRLKHPHAVNPFSAEPDYGLSDEEAAALSAYLLGKKK
ncbi:MAG: c-type cytochrome [Planctomycetes bacterium]|nr:c-type cytochrome [Planctomycetota bacterium]